MIDGGLTDTYDETRGPLIALAWLTALVQSCSAQPFDDLPVVGNSLGAAIAPRTGPPKRCALVPACNRTRRPTARK